MMDESCLFVCISVNDHGVFKKKKRVKHFHRFWLIVETYFGGKDKKKPYIFLRIFLTTLQKSPKFPQDKWFSFGLAGIELQCPLWHSHLVFLLMLSLTFFISTCNIFKQISLN